MVENVAAMRYLLQLAKILANLMGRRNDDGDNPATARLGWFIVKVDCL